MRGWLERHQAFLREFPSERACLDHVADVRWPHGFVCPACGAESAWRAGDGRWVCRGCQRRISVTAGTALHGAHVKVAEWLFLLWIAARGELPCARVAQDVLGIGSYETAWRLCRRVSRWLAEVGGGA